MATTRMMLQRQQHVSAAVLVAISIVLSAILAPAATPDTTEEAGTTSSGDAVSVTSPAGSVSAGATLDSTSATDVPATAATPPPAAGGDVFFDTFRGLCSNRSDENRNNTCGSVLEAACAALDASPRMVDPASHARTAACALALPDPDKGRVECTRFVDYTKVMISAKNRKKLLGRTRKRLTRFCEVRAKYVPAGVVRGDEVFAFLALDPASADASTTTAGTPPPAAGGGDVFDDTFQDLCFDRSPEKVENTCRWVLDVACGALHAKTKDRLSDVTSGTVYLQPIVSDVLSGLGPASGNRTAACVTALPEPGRGGAGDMCLFRSGRKRKQLPAKRRRQLMAGARRRLLTFCGFAEDAVPACKPKPALRDGSRIPDGSLIVARKCLDSFRQAKTTIERSSEIKDTDDVEALNRPGESFTETSNRWTTSTLGCCNAGLSDRCLCHLKKQLGNNTNIRVPCLEKKELQVCK